MSHSERRAAGIEAGRRLVEEHQLGVVDERQRDRQALTLAAGQVLGLSVVPLAELERIDQRPSSDATCG